MKGFQIKGNVKTLKLSPPSFSLWCISRYYGRVNMEPNLLDPYHVERWEQLCEWDTTRKKNKTKKIYMWEKKKQKYMDMYVRQYICV
jgi:hypothetical protein